jgi:drug/metabolite transporter (DMT)-like permease
VSPELMVVITGVLASLSYGSGDFFGASASKRMPAFSVVALGHLLSLVVLIVIAIVSQDAPLTPQDWLFAALAGLSGSLGLSGFYQALSMGKMGLAAPIVAVVATAFPVLIGILTEGRPSDLQFIGFGLGLLGIFLVSYEGSGGSNASNQKIIRTAVLAGLAFGGFFIFMAQVGESAGLFWSLVGVRAASSSFMIVLGLLTKQLIRPPNRQVIVFIVCASILDVGGNIFYILAERGGRLDIAVVTSSLYPAVTVLLAWLVLRERLIRWQVLGLVAALGAVILISL